jgi:hypothetical protein
VSYELKKRVRDERAERRKEILGDWRFYNMEPMSIGREPISIELALQLGMIVEAPE